MQKRYLCRRAVSGWVFSDTLLRCGKTAKDSGTPAPNLSCDCNKRHTTSKLYEGLRFSHEVSDKKLCCDAVVERPRLSVSS